MESILATENYIIVELVPVDVDISKLKESSSGELEWGSQQYHCVSAASLGPGNLAIGLRYRRYTAPPKTYSAIAIWLKRSRVESAEYVNNTI